MNPIDGAFQQASRTLARRRLKARRAASEREALRADARIKSAVRAGAANVVHRTWLPPVLAAVAVLSLAGNVLQYLHYSPRRTLVTVGPRAVSQREYLADLDSTSGKAVLGRIVYGELVRQAAFQAGVFPTPADVDARLAALTGGGAGNARSRESVTSQMALENLRLRGITATDAEIAAYYAANKDRLATPPQAVASLIVTNSAADAAQASRLLAAGKTDAQIAALPRTHAAGVGGFQVNVSTLPPDVSARLHQAVFNAPLGSIVTLPCPGGSFLTVQAHRRSPGAVPSLAESRDTVARLVRLQKAPTEQAELVQLYRASPPSFQMSRYAEYFADAQTASLPAVEAH